MSEYKVVDELFLWWMGDPATPRYVGSLHLLRAGRGVSVRYSPGWIQSGFALSEDLPLVDVEHSPTEPDTAAGAVDDARPDRWGERIIRILDKPPRLSLLEYLFFAGDDRFGALGVSLSPVEYQPRKMGPLPTRADVGEIQDLVRKVKENEAVPEEKRQLLAPGVTMGGLRPKGLIQLEGHQWVVKFRDEDPWDAPLIEHASMTLAAKAKITVSKTFPVKVHNGHAVAVKRFDRIQGYRTHAQSAKVALRAAGSRMGYPELAQLLRRRSSVENNFAQTQMRELFRRMVFNILMDNTDDHERNHVVLLDDANYLRLSPAFDVLPTCQSLGYQQMRVGVQENDSSIDNALSEAAQFGLSRKDAVTEASTVALVCSTWKEHFSGCGVSGNNIEAIAAHIDRPYLADQRRDVAGNQAARIAPNKKTR